MDVILRQDVETLGRAGELVAVKDGYARNYLLPRGLAYQATDANRKRLESERSGKAKVVKANGTRTFFIALNVTRPPFSDVRVRQAANHAVDKKLLGPAYKDVAAKHKGQADAVKKLSAKVKAGGKGACFVAVLPCA